MTNLVSYPFLSEKDADQQLVEKDFLMKRSIRTFGKECSWPNVSSDLPLSISLLLSHFHFTILLYTNYLSFSLSLTCKHSFPLSRSLSDISLYHTPTLTHYLSFYLSLCLSCIPSLFFKHKLSSLNSQSLTFTSENLYPMLSISLSKTLFLFLGLSLTFSQAHSLINPLLLTL